MSDSAQCLEDTIAAREIEIERLRHDRLDCQYVMDAQQAEIERLRAANGLLRAALIDAISYADDAQHPHAQYQDARPSLLRALEQTAIQQLTPGSEK